MHLPDRGRAVTRGAAAAEIIRLGDIIREYQATGQQPPAPIGNAFGDAVQMFDLLSARIPAQRKAVRS